MRWQPGEFPDDATLTLCIDDDCEPVDVVVVPDSSGDRLVSRDYYSEADIAVRLVVTGPGENGQRFIDSKGKFTRGHCTCPYVGFRLANGRLTAAR